MSGFVCIDASVAAKWVLVEDHTDLALKMYMDCLRDEISIVVPPHMRIEVVNSIRKQVARSLITAETAEEYLSDFMRFVVLTTEPNGLYLQAMRIAEQYNRPTAYDANYIALAQIYECDLWTADQRLLNALGGRLPFLKALGDYR